MTQITSGIVLFSIGIGLVLTTLFILRVIARMRPFSQPGVPPSHPLKQPGHNEAVLLVQPGGRVAYLNQQARDWFNHWEDEPNLEQLASNIRPPETFLDLCAYEGQARLFLNNMAVDVTSYFAPFDGTHATLVSLRRPQKSIESSSIMAVQPTAAEGGIRQLSEDQFTQIFDFLTGLNQSIKLDLNLESTIRAVLEQVERLFPTDIFELNTWESGTQQLVPYRFLGSPGSERFLEKASEPYKAGQGYSGYLITQKKPLLISNVEQFQEIRPAVDLQQFPIQSYLGVPLLAQDDFIGTLELASYTESRFTQNDLELLTLLSQQIATGIQNTLVHQAEQQRFDELHRLINLAQAASVMSEPQDLFTRLTEISATLLSVEILGFLTYDEEHKVLEGRIPFKGIPANIIKWYHTTIQPESPAEKIWQSAEVIITTNAPEDECLIALGLQHLAQAAGIRNSIFVPLASSGRIFGYLQAANKSDGLPFNQDDLRKATTISGQVSPLIENTILVQQSQRRAQRAETLRRIASLTSSNATPDEILKYSLLDLARLLQADLALVYLPVESQGEFRLHSGSLFGISPEMADRPDISSIKDKDLLENISLARLQYVSGDLSEDTHLPVIFRPFIEILNIQSVIAVPLVARDRCVGELVLGNFKTDAFSQNDVLTATTAATQLASTIDRAESVAQETQGRLSDLAQKETEHARSIQLLSQRAARVRAGLEIAQSVNRQTTTSDVLLVLGQELLQRMGFETVLIAEASPEPESESSGFRSGAPRLLHTLGKLPVGSNPETLLGQRNPLRNSLQSGAIELVEDLNAAPLLCDIALLQALQARGFVCFPVLTSRGQKFAVLATSQTTLPPFAPEDNQLFNLLSRQVAIALENLGLLNEANRRFQEVNLLLDFSRNLGILNPLKILHNLIESAIRMLSSAQAGMVALWDARKNRLIPQVASGYPHNASLLEISYQADEGLPGQAFKLKIPLRIEEIDISRHFNLTPENLLRYRDGTGGLLPVSSLSIPITSSTHTEPLGVLLLENFNNPVGFTTSDQALITSLTQQTALSLENARLYQASEDRAHQLQALTGVASTITSSLQTNELIAILLDQLQAILPYETGTLWLRSVDRMAHPVAHPGRMVVRAARGFTDSDERVGLSVAVEDSLLLKEMITTGQPISVGDVRADPRFPTLMEFERLSWLGIPLIASGEVIGVIALEKFEANFYTSEHIQAATTFAGQASVALENASLYEESLRRTSELDERSQRLGMLYRLSVELSGSLDIDQILNFAAQELHQAVHCNSVSAILFSPTEESILQAEYPPSTANLPITLPDCPLFNRLRQSLGVYNCEDIANETELAPLTDFLARHTTRSLLVVPLSTGSMENDTTKATPSKTSIERNLHGLLFAHAIESYRFETDEVELARTLSNQVAIAVQNARLFAQTHELTEDLEQRVLDRTIELGREHKRTETLLRIITELSASLDLEHVLDRTLSVLNESVNAAQITVMIVRPGERNLYRLASVGYTQPPSFGGSPTVFNLDQGLASWVISNRKSALISDVAQDPRWVQAPKPPEPRHRSALAVPLLVGTEVLGTLMLFHPDYAHFSIDQLELVQAVANQVAVAVNNAELYRLIRDQAEDLGNMLREQQVETSRSKAILEAVADGVLVTDAQREITLFNLSAEKILNLDRSQALGESLEHFAGLFRRAAQSWLEKINTWSQDPSSYHPGDTFAEQITLESGKVVAVRLSPVILRNDFLGTVSIFQDITHLVEVDRLKTEFVGTVSHELRTPMTSIKGYVEILLMGAAGQIDDQQRRFLQIIKANTDRLAMLVNNLLDISRIESGKVTLTIQPCNLNELVDEAIVKLSHRVGVENKPVSIEKDTPPDLPRAHADVERIRQILDNLLDNAYQYNLPNGQITVRMRLVGNEIQVDIKDTGMGIPQEEQPHVFERFFRGESPLLLGVSGTGLGLSIVQNLVHMHHGRIWLESPGVPGKGSTFSFTLPVYRPEVEN